MDEQSKPSVEALYAELGMVVVVFRAERLHQRTELTLEERVAMVVETAMLMRWLYKETRR